MQLGSVLVLPNIDLQADFSIQLTDFQSVVVLQGKQSMHETHIGVYVRNRECMG